MMNFTRWPSVPLVTICRPRQWKTISTKELEPTGYPVYGANGKIGYYKDYNHAHETLLITCRGATCGTLNFCEPKSYVTGNAMALDELSDQVDLKYLFYSLLNRGFGDVISGSAQPQITGEGLRKVQIPLPPLNAQRKIVEKLDGSGSSSKRIREELDHVPRLILRYKNALLAAAFRGDLSAEWNSTNHGQAWRTETLGNLALDVRYGTAAKCHYKPKATPVLRIPNVARGKIDIQDMKYAVFKQGEIKKLALKQGDLLVIRSNGSPDLVGRMAIVDSSAVGYLFAGYLIRLRLNESLILPDFAALAFEEPTIRSVIERFAKSTSGVHNINGEQLRSLSIPLPSLLEQQEIVKYLSVAFARIDKLQTEAVRATALIKRLDQSILAKAFSDGFVADRGTE